MTFPMPFFSPVLGGWSLGSNLRTAGSAIGDMTALGGLAAAFDGTTSQAFTSSAALLGVAGYCGRNFGATPRNIYKFIVFGSNNFGYSGSNPTITITFYGKNGGAPSSGTDGTSLGSTSFTDTGDESTGREVDCNDKDTAWKYVWAYISASGGTEVCFAEVEIYEAV